MGADGSDAVRRALVVALLLVACQDDENNQGPRTELLDPAACEECHPQHYQQWLRK